MTSRVLIAALLLGLALAGAAADERLAAGADLRGKDLSGRNMDGASLAGANLTGANLAGASLKGADLRDATLRDVAATGADLTGADLGSADLTRADLRRAKLAGATLLTADLTFARLEKAEARKALLGGARLTRARLAGADLSGALLAAADLAQADLRRARLVGANLGARGAGQQDPKPATLRGADLSGADLSGANLTSVDLTEARLKGARLVGTRLDHADLTPTGSTDDEPATATAPIHGTRRQAAVLVTGAAGEVGHGLIQALHRQGRDDVVAIDVRKLDRSVRDECLETYVGDICDSSLLERLLAMYEITEIYHLAALLSHASRVHARDRARGQRRWHVEPPAASRRNRPEVARRARAVHLPVARSRPMVVPVRSTAKTAGGARWPRTSALAPDDHVRVQQALRARISGATTPGTIGSLAQRPRRRTRSTSAACGTPD